ncbi:L-threonine 3-dehydrogenase [Aestuariimicrobium ganziense]|uniref:L-threonine 3-dehydrogenase n=1 Tax=Aestuariimicrobium ganziense TaxID=2773677 RepID=UPI00194301F9|nr:L-threonine 3-dehydrogenase [Aestuariimicrobium ganziense]
MKALVKTRPEPGLELVEVPMPTVRPTDVLIKVRRTGICGTDLHIANWDGWAQANITTPLIVGHELCGDIVEVGAAVEDLEVGMFVSVEGHYVCGRCRACLAGNRHLCIKTRGIGVQIDGAFAEYIAVPAGNVWVHRHDVDPDVAAIFDPFGNAVHTALQFNCLGEDVLVSGAGPIGIMAALVAKHAGARHVVITDLSDERLALATSLGIDTTINVARERVKDVWDHLNLREGFDIGLEMSGAGPALREMIANMTHGGKIAMLGIPSQEISLDLAKVVFSMLTIRGVYGREIFETWYAMSVLLQSGLDISGVITDRFSHTEHEAAFAAAASGGSGKVVMSWDDWPPPPPATRGRRHERPPA